MYLLSLLLVSQVCLAKKSTKTLVESVSDQKDFKKILRTKNNVLVLFIGNAKKASETVRLLGEVSLEVKGLATVLSVDCEAKEGKKLCKKLKVSTSAYTIKHYKDGDFHKDFDRAEKVKSIVTFLKDPTGDLPWEEDPQAQDVVHWENPGHFNKFLKTEKGKVLAMFYAPWCGHCKRMKPEYQAVAAELKGQATLAAMDVNKPENSAISKKFNITGFPTLLYFEGGSYQFQYPGGNNKEDMKKFLADPKPEPEAKEEEAQWSDEPSEVLHLTDGTFNSVLENEPSLLIMFYAPWCGHCKRAKPHFVTAAAKLAASGSAGGKLAAVDCTKQLELSKRFGIKGFPTIKYFKDGEFAFDAGDARDEASILKFLANPQEPPPPPPPEVPWSEEVSDVVHLTEEDFKSFLKKKKHVLVMFYAPWCGHCKRAKPEYKAAAADFAEDPKVEFAAVDCTTDKSVCSAFDVSGFPSIKYFHYYNKEQKPYEGGRTHKDFVTFMSDPLSPFAGQPPPPPSPEEQWTGLDGGLFLKHLTGDEFDQYLKYKDTVLIMFYAPWCGHCKKLAPEYAAAAKILGEKTPPQYVAKVDTTVQEKLGKRFDIKGFPTLKWFVNGKDEEYTGGRTTDTIVSWISKKTGPPAEKISCDDFDTKTADAKLSAVYFGEESGASYDAFIAAAKDSENEKFTFWSTGAECADKLGSSANGIAMKRTFDEPILQYSGDNTGAAVGEWLNGNSVPTLFEFGEDYIEPIFAKRNPAIILFTTEKDTKYQAAFAEAANNLKGKILMSYSGVTEGIQERLGEFIGVTSADLPTMRLIAPEANLQKYVWEGSVADLTADNVAAFYQDFKDGKLVAHRKSEPIPETNDGPVKVIVGHEYEKIVMDETKDVFVKYYAPWCGHCKSLAPKWEEIAESVKGSNLVMAKFDATLNEVDGVEIKGYPTLKFYPMDNKAGMDYGEGREVDDIKKWLSENSKAYQAHFAEAEDVKAEL